MDIKNANIIITGAGSGFGKAMALHFASLRGRVYAVDLDEDSLSSLSRDSSDKIRVFPCDVTDNAQVETTVDKIFDSDKSINVLINNAGIMKNAPLVNLLNNQESRHSLELWEELVSVNQNGVFYMTRAVVNRMIKNRNKGVIINMSSIASGGNAGQTAYSATKAAVEAMTRVWAKELGVFKIRSVAIAPGFIDTSGTHNAIEEKMLAKWIEKTPLKRTGEIDEVVLAAQFCIENDFFNGEVLNLNGGLTI